MPLGILRTRKPATYQDSHNSFIDIQISHAIGRVKCEINQNHVKLNSIGGALACFWFLFYSATAVCFYEETSKHRKVAYRCALATLPSLNPTLPIQFGLYPHISPACLNKVLPPKGPFCVLTTLIYKVRVKLYLVITASISVTTSTQVYLVPQGL